MLLAGSAAFGAVAGWWLLLRPLRRGWLVLAVAVPAAAAATAWLAGGAAAAQAALAGTATGAVAHAAFHMMIRWSLRRDG